MGGDKQQRATNKIIRKINRFSFGFIEGKIDFHEKHNSTYKDNDILASLIFLFNRNRYPENGCKRYKEITKRNVPDADTIYRRIKMKSWKEILLEYNEIEAEIINEVKKRTHSNKAIVLIDEHEIPWYGEPNEYVVGTKNFHGTKLAFKYITINVLIHEYKICLFALPVTPLSEEYELVDELLNLAEKFFKIRLILFDRGFSKDSKILKVVEKHGLKYLAPMEKSDRIKRIANSGDGVNPFYHIHYEFGKEKAKTNLFFIPNEKYEKEKWKNYHVFCTNIDVTKANLIFLADLYGMRWNIENFYRDGENFMIKTKTADFVVRYFFFLFMSILYNLWYLVRVRSPITAQEWKDLVEDKITGENDDFIEIYSIYVAFKNLLSTFMNTGVSSAFYFIGEIMKYDFKQICDVI